MAGCWQGLRVEREWWLIGLVGGGAALLMLIGLLLLSPNRALAAGATYPDCNAAITNFPTDLAGVTSGSATFTFPANCTIPLSSSLQVAAGTDITIQGNGLVLDGQTSSFDIIHINDATKASTLSLDHVTLEHGYSGVVGVNSQSTVDLTNSTITDLTGSTTVVSYGIETGTATLTNSTISDMTAGDQGNNYGVAASTVTLTDSTISGLSSGQGSVGVSGGRISTLTNSTISGISGGTVSFGVDGNTATLTNSTISGVRSTGGESYGVEVGAATLTASILAGNGINCDILNPLVDGGYNLSTDTSCVFQSGSHSQTVTATQLSLLPLGNYGGPTQTIALGLGSVAIDSVPNSFCASLQDVNGNPLTTDQRGIKRPQPTGGACDAGAYEAPALTITLTPAIPDSTTGWYNAATLGGQGKTLAVRLYFSGLAPGQTAGCTTTGLPVPISRQNDILDGFADFQLGLADGVYQITSCTITQGQTDLGFSYTGPSLPLDLKVDTTAPQITIDVPANESAYAPGETIDASYTCTDATSQMATINGCVGTVADGSPIDTSTAGPHTFSVTGTDQAGNTATKRVTYTVGYTTIPLPGNTATVNQGFYALIRFYPEDADGHNAASRNLTVTSVELDGPDSQTIPFVHQFQFGRFSGQNGYQLA